MHMNALVGWRFVMFYAAIVIMMQSRFVASHSIPSEAVVRNYCCGGSAALTTAPYFSCRMRMANLLTLDNLSVDNDA